MNIVPEYSGKIAATTSDCDKNTMNIRILKSIAYEVLRREEQGDTTASDILNTAFSNVIVSNNGGSV